MPARVFAEYQIALKNPNQFRTHYLVSAGKDALGEVASRIQIEDNVYNGRGLSTDIIEASVKSYINAINKYYYEKQLSSNLDA